MLDEAEELASAETVADEAKALQHTPRRKSFTRLGLEVALISVGVFLGMMGEQWREYAQHRDLATSSLRRFRSEFITNRKAVASVQERHATGLAAIANYLHSDAAARARLPMPFTGTHPAFLEYTGWDVALATQSLAYIDADLAHDISHVYAAQRQLDAATRDITQIMYLKASGQENLPGFLGSMAIYFGDCTLLEPRLVKLYDDILPRLNRALGDTPPAETPAK